jgi:hypothetical protein
VECDRQVDEARHQLEQVAGLTREEAKKNLIEQMIDEAKHESAKRLRVIEEEAKEEAGAQRPKDRCISDRAVGWRLCRRTFGDRVSVTQR